MIDNKVFKIVFIIYDNDCVYIARGKNESALEILTQ